MKIGMHAVYERSFASAIREARGYGFDYVQFDLNVPRFYLDGLSGRQIAALRKASRDHGIALTFHAPGDYIGLFTDFPAIRLGMLQRFRKIIEVAGLLESHHVTFHPLAPPSFRTADTRTDDFERRTFAYYRQVFAENVAELERHSTGPLICIENYRLGPVTMAALEPLFRRKNRVALTLDIPKSMDRYDRPDPTQDAFFQRHADRIREIHLHDRDERFSHLVPGDGRIDFGRFRDALTTDTAWVTIEVRPARMAAKAKEWLLNFTGSARHAAKRDVRADDRYPGMV